MSLEWFDRVCGELQEQLESICDQYDTMGHLRIDRAAKHPQIECYVNTEEEERDFFCTIFFDPHNEEFYIEEFDLSLEQTSRVILPDFDDIVDAVHETFHEYLEDEGMDGIVAEGDYFLDEDGNEEVFAEADDFEDEDDYEDEIIEVEWTTPEVLAYSYMDEVEVTYQFGVVQETGDGILRRFNKLVTENNEVVEDETNFIFSKEEAGTIIELIENNMDLMDGFDHS